MSRRPIFHLDLSSCTGCKACQVACKDKHDLPQGLTWRRVITASGGKWEKEGEAWRDRTFTYFVSVACMHCARPICAEVCPTRAITQREDGIVAIDGDRCMGCRYCEWSCPYGAPQFDAVAGVMTKCDLCRDRLDVGRAPACVEACMLRVLTLRDAPEVERPPEPWPLPDTAYTDPQVAHEPHRDSERAAEHDPRIENEEEI